MLSVSTVSLLMEASGQEEVSGREKRDRRDHSEKEVVRERERKETGVKTPPYSWSSVKRGTP